MSDTLEVNTPIQEIHVTEFPMVVFLRGDEPHFTDFCMSADQVMDVLGIRRSRLNQISGRELRVGRARIDNYVRPVYRKQDVEEYLKWIRPTATHKKSSDMLNEARSKLEEQSDRLSQVLSSRFETMIGNFTSDLQTQFFDQKKFSKSMLILMQKNLRMSLKTLLARSSFMQTQSIAHWEDIKKRFEDMSGIRKELEQIKAASVQISDMVRYNERVLLEVQDSHKQVRETLDKISDQLEDIKNPATTAPLPLVRQRRGQGAYSRVRQDFKNSPVFPSSCAEIPGFFPAWRRKKVSIKK